MTIELAELPKWYPSDGKEWENHEATYEVFGDIIHIHWRNPEDSHFSVHAIIHDEMLCIYGDLGEAVYRWSSPISLASVARCHIFYFNEKCCASEVGRRFDVWLPNKALEDFDESIEELKEAGSPIPDDDLIDETRDIICGGDERVWDNFISNRKDDLYGSDGGETAYEIGREFHGRCYHHLNAMKLAYLWLKKYKEGFDDV